MIRSRCTIPHAFDVTIKPPFDKRANAETARSISPASRMSIGRSSIPRWCNSLDCAELADAGRYGRIAKNCRAGNARGNFFQQLKPFYADAIFEIGKTGGVPARVGQAVNETCANGIGRQSEHDWHAACCLEQCLPGTAGEQGWPAPVRTKGWRAPACSLSG